MKWRLAAGAGTAAIVLFAVPAACQAWQSHVRSDAREHAIGNVRGQAAKDLADIVADPATRGADPRQAAQRVAAYLSPPNPAETTLQGKGFEVRTRFDEPWSDQGQEHRVRLCVAYVTRDAGTDPVTLADRPCPEDPTFIPGLDEVVKTA
ncbi:hypothetical protein [Amycolatopsis vancoresmycina]|uniref:Secreted protein n=1 Tax=Amycolatopsis vancoresmycina DSM 44592 TaxID=1292037 RepID=R1G2N3_9PSEU|nr:hypothetical protein [Amycolatopsis vancoresmycina]EOD65768.1 hypothetical protein H480_24967 [Amycolatopsis vancoresmycina DSM 44592]